VLLCLETWSLSSGFESIWLNKKNVHAISHPESRRTLSVIQEELESKRDVNIKTAQLVQLLTEIGPDIPEISRKLGQFKESVRYRYKEKILNKGMTVQGVINDDRLGLKRVIAVVDLTEEYRDYAESIFTSMNELCFLTNFYKTTPDGLFLLGATVPAEFVSSYIDLMLALKEKGLFRTIEISKFEWFRAKPMRAEFYDFNTGRWDFDWTNSDSRGLGSFGYTNEGAAHFDRIDLLILKELQIDATRSFTEIASKLGVEYKKATWHLTEHVLGRGLLRGYKVNWTGGHFDIKRKVPLQNRHKYLVVEILANGISEAEKISLVSRMDRIPFVWAEAIGDCYFGEVFIPTDYLSEGLQYLQGVIAPIRDKARYFLVDQTTAMTFSLSYQLYDEQTRHWRFDVQDLLHRYENVLMKIKGSTG
jgi:hypothetical protein